jgi:undecaprenyl-diphosphatase
MTIPRGNTVRRLAAATAGVAFAALTAGVWFNHKLPFGWELWATRRVQAIRVLGFDAMMRAVSWPGNGVLAQSATVAVACGACLLGGLRRAAAGLAAAGAGAYALNVAVKWLVARPRPTLQEAAVMTKSGFYGFPSGHVMFYTAFYGLLFVLAVTRLRTAVAGRALATFCAALIALVGASRVYLGAHWAADVIAAYLLGFVWLAIILEGSSLWETPRPFNARNGGFPQ